MIRKARTKMLRQDYMRTLKQTHQTASTVMPLVTAGLAVMSALIAAQERRAAHAATVPAEQTANPLDRPRIVSVMTPAAPSGAQAVVSARERRVSVFAITFSIIGSVI